LNLKSVKRKLKIFSFQFSCVKLSHDEFVLEALKKCHFIKIEFTFNFNFKQIFLSEVSKRRLLLKSDKHQKAVFPDFFCHFTIFTFTFVGSGKIFFLLR